MDGDAALTLSLASIPCQAENDAQIIDLWLHGRSAETQKAYRKAVRRFQAVVGKPLAHVTLRDFQAYVDQLQGAPDSKRLAVASMKSLYGFASKVGYLRFNV